MAGRPFAVFDIDGTIIRWQLYHALADELVRLGKLDAAEFDKVRLARRAWKQRAQADAYSTYEQTLINLVEGAITNIQVKDFETACINVIKEYQDQVYIFTRDLIKELQAKNYLLFAISASQIEIVKLLANYYEFDDYGGSVYEISEGRFVGQKELLKSERKPIYLNHLVEKHKATWGDSIAVGDSEGDIQMLSSVETAIAFNPTKELFEHAKARAWQIVVERKNMIYKFKPDGDTYRLEA